MEGAAENDAQRRNKPSAYDTTCAARKSVVAKVNGLATTQPNSYY
jgi:hypothetical protein